MNHPYRSFRFSRQRPSWWPENESWPPVRPMRLNRLIRRLGCLFVLFNLIGLGVLVVVIAFIARALGLVQFSFNLTWWTIPFGMTFTLIVLTIMGVGGLGMRRVFIPLNNLLEAAGRVAEGDYTVRVPERGQREVRAAARAFNAMAARLSETDEQRRNLLADVTHELRNPLTVMQGNLEGMLDGVYPADETNLRSLLEETNILARLVEDLRTLALAESGALQLKTESTDLAMLIRDTLAVFQTQADSKSISLTVESAEDLAWVDLDPGRVRQVLINLLANALRYTPAGGTISIRYQQVDRQALLEVQDSGPGIPSNELPHVFERFYKSTDSGGMGLGLAIARHLVEAHGGTITAESAPGEGTTMRITIPLGE